MANEERLPQPLWPSSSQGIAFSEVPEDFMPCNQFLKCLSFPRSIRQFMKTSKNWLFIDKRQMNNSELLLHLGHLSELLPAPAPFEVASGAHAPAHRQRALQTHSAWWPSSLEATATLSLPVCKIQMKQDESLRSSWVRTEITVQIYTNIVLSICARAGLHKAVLQVHKTNAL